MVVRALFAAARLALGVRVGQHSVFLTVVEEVVHDFKFKIVALVIGEDDDIAFILHWFAPHNQFFPPLLYPKCGKGASQTFLFRVESEFFTRKGLTFLFRAVHV